MTLHFKTEQSRVWGVLGKDGLLPPFLTRQNKRLNQTPETHRTRRLARIEKRKWRAILTEARVVRVDARFSVWWTT